MLARLAFLALLIAPAMALAADAPPNGGKLTVVAQPPPKAAAARAPMSPLPAAAAPAAAQDASACRMDCAQSLYICRAGDEPDECNDGWSQCVAACNTPNLAPATTPAP